MENRDLLSQTAQIVSSHLSHNPVPQAQISDLIREVFGTLSNLGGQGQPSAAGHHSSAVEDRPSPAVPVKRSVFPDHIVCLEDGKKLKMLKRHLMTSFQMTPDDYRRRWGLPQDYPMVAPNYAQTRSSLAKKIGLGRRLSDDPAPRMTTANGHSNTSTASERGSASGPSVRRIPEGVSSKRGRPRKAA